MSQQKQEYTYGSTVGTMRNHAVKKSTQMAHEHAVAIKQFREYLQLDRGELAERIGSTRQTVMRWECGQGKPHPTPRDKLLLLAAAHPTSTAANVLKEWLYPMASKKTVMALAEMPGFKPPVANAADKPDKAVKSKESVPKSPSSAVVMLRDTYKHLSNEQLGALVRALLVENKL